MNLCHRAWSVAVFLFLGSRLASLADDVLINWNEVRNVGGQTVTIVGRQMVNRTTGQQHTEYYDAQGQAMPATFTRANQRQWGDNSAVHAAAKVAPDRLDTRLKQLPLSVRERIATNSASVLLDAPDLTPILAEDRANQTDEKGPLRIGFFRDLPQKISISPANRGRWFSLPDGTKLWLLLVSSPGAEGIRIHLANLNLPAGVQLAAFVPSQPSTPAEVHTASDLHGDTDFWTETTFSSKAGLEVVVPPGVDASNLQFEVDKIIHVYVKLANWIQPKVGTCHNDVTCYPDWATQAAGVAGLGTVGQAGFLFCTGCLIADTDPTTIINYFMTANHCIKSQSQASTTEFYWFYQTSTCNGTPPDILSVPRTTGGADFLAGASRYVGSDFAFMRLRNNPPGGVGYEGWSTSQLAPNEAVAGIHHPDGTYKRISFGNFVSYAGNFTDVQWYSGVTEPGSSGSPLFNSNKEFVGQLYGGNSACNLQQGIDDYGRFDITYPIIASYLSPPPASLPPVLLHFQDAQDFDGDGKADLALFYPGSSTWYFNESTAGMQSRQFGWSGTLQVRSDFDNDGRSDYCVYYPPTGNWYIQTRTNFITRQFGYDGTLPVPGDYDGDGHTDLAVFHQQSGTWYVLQTAAGFRSQQFGYSATLPVPDDYDGDGKTDIAVYEKPTGNWYLLQSTAGFKAVQFGYSPAVPEPADYDGDGKADLAVFDPQNANWYVQQTTRGFTNVLFGLPGDIAVPADYDGDGKVDLATYTRSTGTWNIRKSTGGTSTDQFGWSDALPVGVLP